MNERTTRTISRSGAQRTCPGCGQRVSTFFPVDNQHLYFKNHKEPGGVEWCRESRAMVESAVSR